MKSAARKAGNKHSPLVKKQDSIKLLNEINAFFDYADLNQSKAFLWVWLRATVTGSFNKKMGRYDRVNIIELYERLVELMEKLYQFHEACRSRVKQA